MLQRGEDIVVGVGVEETRGTPAAPQIYVPARSPSGIQPALEKTIIKETRGTKIASNASEITQSRAEGDLEFNVRVESVGFILKSLLGSAESAAKGGESGVYEHTFGTLLNDPEHPSLTLSLSQPANQDYQYPLALASSIEMKVTPDDLINAVVNFIAKKEQEKSGAKFSPAFVSRDYYFRHQDVEIKIADTVDDLAAADPLSTKEFSLSIANGARVDQNISEFNPGNVLGLVLEPKGSFVGNLADKSLHDIFVAGTYKAMQITLERSDVTIGSASHPTIVITLPKVSFEKWDADRPIDDIVTEKIEFTAHYDEDEAKAIEIVVTNERVDYDSEESS